MLQEGNRSLSCNQLIARFASTVSVVVASSPTYPKHTDVVSHHVIVPAAPAAEAAHTAVAYHCMWHTLFGAVSSQPKHCVASTPESYHHDITRSSHSITYYDGINAMEQTVKYAVTMSPVV
jgi:hypothetical protein